MNLASVQGSAAMSCNWREGRHCQAINLWMLQEDGEQQEPGQVGLPVPGGVRASSPAPASLPPAVLTAGLQHHPPQHG